MSITSAWDGRFCTAQCGRQPVAHRAEAAAGHPAFGLLEAEMLGCPHLVLAHFGGHVDVAVPGQFVKPLHGLLLA